MKVRGSPVGQINYIYQESGVLQYGESKHEAKEQAREQGAKNWHDIGKNIGVYSYKTATNYKSVAIEALRYARENFGVKSALDLKQEHIQAYMESKIREGLAKTTLKEYAAALEKLEVVLNKFSEKYDLGKEYRFDLSEVREQIRNLEHNLDSRAYERPQELINALNDTKFEIAARLQYEAGLRVSEAALIKDKQLTPTEKGYTLEIQGKGGKIREVEISKELGDKLKENMQNGRFEIDKKEYREAIKEAALKTNQEYKGTHGLRHNYAQESFVKHALENPATAKEEVSKELGHNRPYITDVYLNLK